MPLLVELAVNIIDSNVPVDFSFEEKMCGRVSCRSMFQGTSCCCCELLLLRGRSTDSISRATPLFFFPLTHQGCMVN